MTTQTTRHLQAERDPALASASRSAVACTVIAGVAQE